ncbi:G-protein coupled receptor dmsr-1-like [Mytilus galloprovincialis]|uniref:G-protein coupled receptor dmsr-1-like n=1 Tax=Mytilus galloprovincialis TaxID=29158 RepID=UPI003F7C5F0A
MNSSEDIPSSYPDNALFQFASWFTGVHGYVSLIICTFGVCTNIFNITILSRSDMRSPTNVMLTWLAVSDILTMIPYIPFAIHFYCVFDPMDVSPEKFTKQWTTYMQILVNLAATTHTISIWLGVALAVFRFVQMRTTATGPIARKRSMKQAKTVIIVVYIVSTLILIPNYVTNEIEEVTMNNKTMYVLKDLKLASNQTDTIVLVNVLVYSILAKLIPCALMVVFGGSLLYSLAIKGKSRRRRLSTNGMGQKRETRQTKTTRMLLVVMILFLVTEFPQGVLIFMSAVMKDFYHNVYVPLGDLMDFIALVNNAINFVLYCSMSQQFRSKFLEMYLRRTSKFKKIEKLSFTHSFTKTLFTDVHS